MKTREILAQVQCFHAEQAMAFALKAYYAAGRALLEDFKASGEPWVDDSGVPWSSPGMFLYGFHDEFTRRLNTYAIKHRLRPSGMASPVLGWDLDTPPSGPVSLGPQLNDLHSLPPPLRPSPPATDAPRVLA